MSATLDSTVDRAQTETDDAKALKSAAARLLGRRGGLKGGPARAAKLSPEERTRIAVIASETRWKDKPWKVHSKRLDKLKS